MTVNALDFQLCEGKTYYRKKHRDDIKAIVFGCTLLALMLFCLVAAFLSTGPIILGTEMNTNGKVEYLCLGSDCENFTAFRWNDK